MREVLVSPAPRSVNSAAVTNFVRGQIDYKLGGCHSLLYIVLFFCLALVL